MVTNILTYRCPHCENVVELPETFDGDVVTCPMPQCRRDFTVDQSSAVLAPAGAANQQTGERMPRAETGDVEEPVLVAESQNGQAAFTHEDKDESVLATFSAPMFRRYPLQFAGCLILVVLGAAGLIAAAVQSSIALAVFSSLVLAAGAGALAWWWWNAKRRTLAITETSLVIHEGMVSDSVKEIHLDHISRIEIYQPWYCKMLDAGALEIAWGDTSEEVYLDSVRHPHRIVELIRNKADKNQVK